MDRGFFPLDEELELDGKELTPQAHESLVRLASWVPFAPAAQLAEALLGVRVSKSSARRYTLRAGAAELQEWEEQTAALTKDLPEVQAEASHQVMSADGAMVPLVGGAWAEVKTLVIGNVGESQQKLGEKVLEDLSYCSRLTDVPGFERATLREVHRRGVEAAEQVAAVTDGADWLQGFLDYHRATATRILDFAHAASYVHEIGELTRLAGIRLPTRWEEIVRHHLKHEGPGRVLAHLAKLSVRVGTAEIEAKLAYLHKRERQMQYPRFREQGWPIGSGMVESANKLVVEARLKGAGMHWKPENVNRMLLLRNAVCNDRWEESWQERWKQEQQRRKLRRQAQTQARFQQAMARLLHLLLWVRWPDSQDHEASPAPGNCPPASPPVPKGRTPAQYQWGRRPVSLRGAHLKAEFAKL